LKKLNEFILTNSDNSREEDLDSSDEKECDENKN
jgi:hypothetical protein